MLVAAMIRNSYERWENELTKACRSAPIRRELDRSMCRLRCHPRPEWECTSTQHQQATNRVSKRIPKIQEERTHLLRLALPRPLSIVRPLPRKRRLSRLHHTRLGGMSRCVSLIFSFDGRGDGPAAVGRMRQMFLQRIVALLPAVHRFVAKIAHAVVGVLGPWLEEEAGAGELKRVSTFGCGIRPRQERTYGFWVDLLVRPVQSFGALCC